MIPLQPADDWETHFRDVADKLFSGRLVTFLGAGINLCDRPPDAKFSLEGREYLPSGAELAHFLAAEYHFPESAACAVSPCGMVSSAPDLAKVSQYGVTRLGRGDLYDKLRQVFGREYPMTSAHQFLAKLCCAAPKALKPEDNYPMIVTTNYDDLVERALLGAGIPFDLVYYDSGDDQRGIFWHQAPGAKDSVQIPREKANEYEYPLLENRPVVLKVHGTIGDREDQKSGVVITEDDYIDYMASEALDKLLPPRLLGKLRSNHLLFLGYSLRDLNLRVFLRRVKRIPAQSYVSWAVVKSSTSQERQNLRDTSQIDVQSRDLVDYLKTLAQELDSRTVPGTFNVWN